jgi:ligand-binding sensor domain-containing protein
VATIAGLYRTDDGGETWFKLPGELMEQTVFALYQTEDGTILAGAADGLWASTDYGVTWMRVPGMPVMTVLKIGRIEVAGASWLWAGTEGSGLWLSTDDGRSWRYGGLEGHTVYAVHKASEGNLIAATDGGLLEWAIRDSSGDLSWGQGQVQVQDMVRSSSMRSQDTESHEGDAVYAEAGH